jgi:hypothetical protein
MVNESKTNLIDTKTKLDLSRENINIFIKMKIFEIDLSPKNENSLKQKFDDFEVKFNSNFETKLDIKK